MSSKILRELIEHLAEEGRINGGRALTWIARLDKEDQAVKGMLHQIEHMRDEPDATPDETPE